MEEEEGSHLKQKTLALCGQGPVEGGTGNQDCFLKEITFELGRRKRGKGKRKA